MAIRIFWKREEQNMIYTITCNPSLDYIVSVEDFALGKTNRTASEQMLPGGKGINVSTVLGNLGVESVALGFSAGFVGEEIRRQAQMRGVRTDFIHLASGNSRINLKLKNYDGTEINGMGPEAGPEDVKKLYAQIDRLQPEDVLVMAGSLPSGLPSGFYGALMERLAGRGVLCIVDTAGKELLDVLKRKPFLIKPNRDELGELFGAVIGARQEAIPYARKLQEMGAVNVLVSLGGEGAVLAGGDGAVYESPAPSGRLVNAVGAGDSMVAGFLAGWLSRQDCGHAFYMGLAAGSASAFSENLAEKKAVDLLYQTLRKRI